MNFDNRSLALNNESALVMPLLYLGTTCGEEQPPGDLSMPGTGRAA